MSEMNFDEAVEALQTADATESHDPETVTVETSSPTPPTPEGSDPAVTPEAEAPEGDSFTRADLDSLLEGISDPSARERIETAYKSFQGDYTRKTQAIAEKEKQLEQFGNPDDIKQALEFQAQLADPRNWPQMHQELTTALQQMGYTPAEAAQVAADQMTEAAATKPSLDEIDDPELEPVKNYVQNLESRFEALTAEIEAERQTQRTEQMRLAVASELTRQENAIRQSNPSYDDDDVATIYEMSSFYGGDLFQAQERFEQVRQNQLSKYLEQKGIAQETPGVHPVPGAESGSVQTVTPSEMSDKDIDALARRVIDESGALNTF